MAVLQGLISEADEPSAQEPWENLPVHPDRLPPLAEGDYQSISPMWLKVALRRHWVLSALVVVGVVVAHFVFREWLLLLALVVPVILFFWGNVALKKIYYSKKYMLRLKDITYKSGWIWHSVTSVPYNRIQHVEIEQGPIEKIYGLSTLEVYTAGKSTSDLSIPGLESETAEKLKDFVLGQVMTKQEEE